MEDSITVNSQTYILGARYKDFPDPEIDGSENIIEYINTYYNTTMSGIIENNEVEVSDRVRSRDSGKITSEKSPIVSNIYEFMVSDILRNRLGIDGSRIELITDARSYKGIYIDVNPKFDENYFKRINNAAGNFVRSNMSLKKHGLNIDGIVKVDGRALIVSEHKTMIDITDFRRALQDFSLIYDQFPLASYIIFALENDIGRSDYAEDKPQDELCGNMSVHTFLSYCAFNVEIFVLLDDARSSKRPIHNLVHFKTLSHYKLLRTYVRLEEILRAKLNLYGLEYEKISK